MMSFRNALCLILLLTAATCQHTKPFQSSLPSETAKPWTHLEFRSDPGDFRFAVVSDRTGNERPGVFGRAVDRLNLLQPGFVMCVGDLIEGYTTSDRLAEQWGEFDALVRGLEMPFFYTPGNHDVSNAAMEAYWRAHYGPTYLLVRVPRCAVSRAEHPGSSPPGGRQTGLQRCANAVGPEYLIRTCEPALDLYADAQTRLAGR